MLDYLKNLLAGFAFEKVLSAVKAKVPAYMLPDQILRRREMPKNANGKIDRKELTRDLEEQTGNET